jgi:hypothetical protein
LPAQRVFQCLQQQHVARDVARGVTLLGPPGLTRYLPASTSACHCAYVRRNQKLRPLMFPSAGGKSPLASQLRNDLSTMSSWRQMVDAQTLSSGESIFVGIFNSYSSELSRTL